MNTKLIGLVGYARSGKDSVADMLARQWTPLVRVGMADPLKRMVVSLINSFYPVPVDGSQASTNAWVEKNKETRFAQLGGKSVRELLQTLGTEWGRNQVDHDIWVNIATSRTATCIKERQNVVWTDVRFPNEFERLKFLGGEAWFIKRAPMVPRMLHESELHIPNLMRMCDCTISNDGSLEDLEQVVRQMLGEA